MAADRRDPGSRAARRAREKRASELGRYFIGECGCRCPIRPDGRIEWCECEGGISHSAAVWML